MSRSHLIIAASLALPGCNGLDLSDNFYYETSSASSTLATGQLESTTNHEATGGSSTSRGPVADTSGSVDPTTSSTTTGDSDTSEGSAGESPPKCWPKDPSSKQSFVFATPYGFHGDLSLDDSVYEKKPLEDYIKSNLKNGSSKVDRADLICQYIAFQADLPGTYAAWLSTDTQGVASRLKNLGASPPRHFIRTDGECVANSWDEWLDEHMATMSISPYGNTSIEATRAWTGSKENGSAADENCDAWSSKSETSRGDAGRTGETAEWSNVENDDPRCNIPLPLYCLQYTD